MYRFTPALILIALFAMPMSAAEQASAAAGPGGTPPSKHMQRGYFGAKGGSQSGATMEGVAAATTAVDPCEACKAAKRESMRGPKGGYLVPKGTSYYAIEHKITEACRLACAE